MSNQKSNTDYTYHNEKITTLSGNLPKVNSPVAPAEIDPETGQREDYWVLRKEEIAKGFVRPFCDSYIHTVCNKKTGMDKQIAESFARDPKFYGSTFCTFCKGHFPVSEFVWTLNRTEVGS